MRGRLDSHSDSDKYPYDIGRQSFVGAGNSAGDVASHSLHNRSGEARAPRLSDVFRTNARLLRNGACLR